MNAFMCVVLPSVVGLGLYYVLTKEEKYFNLGLIFSSLCLFSNFLTLIVLKLLNNFEGDLILYITENAFFAIKYIGFMLLINFFLAFIFSVIKKGLVLEVKIDEEDKKRKN